MLFALHTDYEVVQPTAALKRINNTQQCIHRCGKCIECIGDR